MKSANNNDKCPICEKASEEKHHPFCSSRCTDIDLGRWLKGSYVLPGETVTGAQDEEAE